MIALAQPREIEGAAMADDVEKAILFAFDQSGAVAHDLRERAVGYLRDVQVRDRGERPRLRLGISLRRDAETLNRRRRPPRPERGEARASPPTTSCATATATAIARGSFATPPRVSPTPKRTR
jgi:hypothetical protein